MRNLCAWVALGLELVCGCAEEETAEWDECIWVKYERNVGTHDFSTYQLNPDMMRSVFVSNRVRGYERR